jgi:hypothetical protein
MHARTAARLSLLLLTVIVPLAACGGSSSAPPSQGASVPAPAVSPSGQAALTGAAAAPGSERFDPDPHPENAHLTQVTTDSLAQSITDYVQAESTRRGGEFPLNDPEQQATLGLTLTTVHRERLSQLADGRYFACADFKGRDGHTYDVDIFMRRESTGLTPTEVIVHKQDGKPRFDWVERNGRWAQVPVTPR